MVRENWIVIGKSFRGKTTVKDFLEGKQIIPFFHDGTYTLKSDRSKVDAEPPRGILIDTDCLTGDVHKNIRDIYTKVSYRCKIILVIDYKDLLYLQELNNLFDIVVETFDLNPSTATCLTIVITKTNGQMLEQCRTAIANLRRQNIIADGVHRSNIKLAEFGFSRNQKSGVLRYIRAIILNYINQCPSILLQCYKQKENLNQISIHLNDRNLTDLTGYTFSNETPRHVMFTENMNTLTILEYNLIYFSEIYRKLESDNIIIQTRILVIDQSIDVYFNNSFEIKCDVLIVEGQYFINAWCLRNSTVKIKDIRSFVNEENLTIKLKQLNPIDRFPTRVEEKYEFPIIRLESVNVSGRWTKYASYNNRILDLVVEWIINYGQVDIKKNSNIRVDSEVINAKFCINECMRTEKSIQEKYPSARNNEDYLSLLGLNKKKNSDLYRKFKNAKQNKFPHIYDLLIDRNEFAKLNHSDFKFIQKKLLEGLMQSINEYLQNSQSSETSGLMIPLGEVLLKIQNFAFNLRNAPSLSNYIRIQRKNIKEFDKSFGGSLNFNDKFLICFRGNVLNNRKNLIKTFGNILEGIGNILKKLIRLSTLENRIELDNLLKDLREFVFRLIAENDMMRQILYKNNFTGNPLGITMGIARAGQVIVETTLITSRLLASSTARVAITTPARVIGLFAGLLTIPAEIGLNGLIAHCKSGFYDHLLDLTSNCS